jgi:hypothetical protein
MPRWTEDFREVDEETSSLGWNLAVSSAFLGLQEAIQH